MITLYAFPMSCSYGPQVALTAAGVPFALEWVRWPEVTLADGRDYRAINPRMQVPALALADGPMLTETPAILQYIADLAPEAGLAPANGTLARTRLQEMMNYLSSELHKQVLWSLANLFRFPGDQEAVRAVYLDMLRVRLDYLEERLGAGPFLMGARFGLADAQFHVLLYLAGFRLGTLAPWPGLQAYLERLLLEPAVGAVFRSNLAERERLAKAGRPV